MTITLRASKRARRKLNIRKNVIGTSKRPRLSVFRSNRYTIAQIIDDSVGNTLASISMKDVVTLHKGKAKKEAAFEVGKKIAEVALAKKITQVVFDRNGNKYHGRVSALADGAREGGLNF